MRPSRRPAAEDAKSTEAPKQSLHIVARVKRPKNPASKKKVVEPANRREFPTDVLALVNAAYAPPAEVTLDKFKETTKKFNTFKQFAFTIGEKYVHVYFYAPKKEAVKTDPYEVALIFEYPSAEHNNLSGKIELSLEVFALGNKAQERLLRRGRRTCRRNGCSRRPRSLLTALRASRPRGLGPLAARAGTPPAQLATDDRQHAGGFDPQPDLIPFELHDRDPDRSTDQDPFRSFPAENEHPAPPSLFPTLSIALVVVATRPSTCCS